MNGVEGESAFEFFSRNGDNSSRHFVSFGIPPLDDARRASLRGKGTQANLSREQDKGPLGHASQQYHPSYQPHQPSQAPDSSSHSPPVAVRRDVVELLGVSGSGKTEVAMHAAASVVLPESMGGSHGTVLWFDSELRLCAERFVGILMYRIEAAIGSKVIPDETTGREIVQSCMKRFLVFRCLNSLQVLSTLHSFTEEWMRRDHVKLIVFDSIASFYWRDLETEHIGAGLHVSVPLAIRDLLNRYNVAVLAIKPTLMRPKQGAPSPEYLSKTWQRLVGLQVFLECMNGHSSFRASAANTLQVLFDFAIANDGISLRVG